MVRIETKNLKYATKELNSSVSVYLDLTEPKRNEINRNETTEIPKLFRFGRPLVKLLIVSCSLFIIFKSCTMILQDIFI